MPEQTQDNLIPYPRTSDESGHLKDFERVKLELELASSIDEVTKIRDQAETLRQYAKKARLGLQMQNQCAEVKLRAERRTGEMLKEMDLHKGGRPTRNSSQGENGFPKLSELGIDRNMSSRCQLIASIPEAAFDTFIRDLTGRGKELTSASAIDHARFLERENHRRQRRESVKRAGEHLEPDERVRVLHGNFREILTPDVVEPGSVRLVLTDLPYGREYLDLWDSLGELCQRVLSDGGMLAAYSGCANLPEVLTSLTKHLDYCWTAALLNESFADTIFHPMRIKSLWKPVLIFSKGRPEPSANENPSLRYLKDVINGDGLKNLNKRDHPWQQGVGESARIIESLTLPGDLVLDPCCGSGSFGVACKRLGRRFLGCDVDQEAVNHAISWIAAEPEPSDA